MITALAVIRCGPDARSIGSDTLAEQSGTRPPLRPSSTGVFAGHEFELGIFGGFGSPLVAELIIAVHNDAAYGAEVHHFDAGADLGPVTFPDTDIAAIPRGLEATGITVRSTDDLGAVGDWAHSPDGVLVIDAKIISEAGPGGWRRPSAVTEQPVSENAISRAGRP